MQHRDRGEAPQSVHDAGASESSGHPENLSLLAKIKSTIELAR
jgi:hypothetical protein